MKKSLTELDKYIMDLKYGCYDQDGDEAKVRRMFKNLEKHELLKRVYNPHQPRNVFYYYSKS